MSTDTMTTVDVDQWLDALSGVSADRIAEARKVNNTPLLPDEVIAAYEIAGEVIFAVARLPFETDLDVVTATTLAWEDRKARGGKRWNDHPTARCGYRPGSACNGTRGFCPLMTLDFAITLVADHRDLRKGWI